MPSCSLNILPQEKPSDGETINLCFSYLPWCAPLTPRDVQSSQDCACTLRLDDPRACREIERLIVEAWETIQDTALHRRLCVDKVHVQRCRCYQDSCCRSYIWAPAWPVLRVVEDEPQEINDVFQPVDRENAQRDDEADTQGERIYGLQGGPLTIYAGYRPARWSLLEVNAELLQRYPKWGQQQLLALPPAYPAPIVRAVRRLVLGEIMEARHDLIALSSVTERNLEEGSKTWRKDDDWRENILEGLYAYADPS